MRIFSTVAAGAVGNGLLAEDLGELPALVEQFEQLALRHAAVQLAGILGEDLADADLVGLGFRVAGLVLEHLAVSLERALIIAVEVAGPALHEEVLDLGVAGAQAGGVLIDALVGGVGLLLRELEAKLLGGRIVGPEQALVVADMGVGAIHLAVVDGGEGAWRRCTP